ncbi:e3 ubiquitin-protein ligase RNF25 [Caerostris extrusa]|uniref:E3 ubiquitin-protein ligase RNF25 n=1 Tax=Caerostris extrusa TaxID=172846 RepID=A0AAV4Q5I9_CAEEX|nr:e3 ubiquitin-protein ligase RNF25 [Caerostris extrusa]
MEEVSESASLKTDDANGIDFHCFVEQELETLQCIYINEIAVQHEEKCTTVSLDIHPATADNHDEQYVRMTLKFNLNTEYPETIPEISIHNPRGLSEEKN